MRRRGDSGRAGRLPAPVIVLATLAIVAVACTGGSDDAAPATIASTTTIATIPRADDGVLRIGALIPSADTAVGVPLTASVKAAVRAVNASGGVLGNDVELQIADEGTGTASATQAIATLVDDGVDAIVGPTSSNTAIGALDAAVTAGVVVCSATATAISLDDFPDDNLFFRSVAPDSLQAVAIAEEAQATGAGNITIVHVDDAYGRPYADAVVNALESGIVVQQVAIPFDDDDLTDDVEAVIESAPQVLVVIGSSDDSAKILEALGRRTDLNVANIIVNDSLRAAANAPVIAALPATLRNRIVVIAPAIMRTDDSDPADNPPFDAQVVDCVNLIALSAIQGNSDSPSVIAGQMSSVSDGGAVCTDFATCSARLADGSEIDYNGPTGITDLGRDGDPSRAFFDRFRFAEDGSEVFERSIAVFG